MSAAVVPAISVLAAVLPFIPLLVAVVPAGLLSDAAVPVALLLAAIPVRPQPAAAAGGSGVVFSARGLLENF
ncbi:hypothetical protein [Nonomuraea sp. NPDC049709]|uniref:hypothetical protein n=1 Tax=Nonomuraea sp. NPDC049709 TaxID=3154736 RepID=UPI00344083B1